MTQFPLFLFGIVIVYVDGNLCHSHDYFLLFYIFFGMEHYFHGPVPLILQIVGDGNFAVVRLCYHRQTRREFAAKIIDKSKCQVQRYFYAGLTDNNEGNSRGKEQMETSSL
jgi:hypothetical protein